MKNLYSSLFALLMLATAANSQITLTGSKYTEDFTTLGGGLPTGWTVYTGAGIDSLGTVASFTNAATSWGDWEPGKAGMDS